MSATAELPTLELTLSATVDAEGGLTGFVDVVGGLGSAGGGSPLAGLGQALGGLEERLDIDLSGISQRLPQALETVRNALPPDALRYVEAIEEAYRGVMAFLQESELVKQVRAGADLEQTALALVNDLLNLFRSRLAELAANLVGAEELARVKDALDLVEALRDDFAGNAGELPELLANQLIGVAPDLLDDATAQLGTALAVLEPLGEANLSIDVGPARAALAGAAAEVAQAVLDFDPADAALYGQLEVKLQGLQAALDAAFDALEAFYAAMTTVVESHAWETLFSTYAGALDAIPLDAVPTVDDAVEQIAAVLDDLLARLTMTFSPDDLAERITRLSTRVQDTFAQSPLGQARQIILDFLEQIRESIEGVPTEEVQQAVTAMLQRVKQELDALGITSIRASIEQGFQDAATWIDDTLDDDLLQQVEDALQGLLDQLDAIPIAQVGQALTDAVNSVGTVVADVETALEEGLEEVRGLLARLDEVSFTPVADEVLEEIDTLKAKLQAIKPEALSDAEKFAITAGLALLRAIDLETLIANELKAGFTVVGNEIKGVINQVIAAWEDFRRRLGGFDPSAVLGPLDAVLGEVTGTVERLNGTVVLGPLYEQVDALQARLETLSPGALLDPLQGPYDQAMAVVERVNPDVWVQPLRTLYGEIDRLLDVIDVRPLLDRLEAEERALFGQARAAIVDGLDSVQLPPPLDAFYAQIKRVTLALTDAVFGDPEAGIRDVNLQLSQSVKLSSLFVPLDAAFDQLLRMLDGVPHDDLVAVMEGLRTGLGTALPALDPGAVLARLREGQGRLEELSPALAAAAIPALPALHASLSARLEAAPPGNAGAAASLQARFDLVVAPVRIDVESSRLRRLQASHEALVTAYRRQLNALDATGARTAYARLHANLGRLLPAFLQQPRPVTYEDIRAGLAELRPSGKARRLDAGVERFLAQLRPMEDAINPAVDGFFGIIRDTMLIIHPGTLKEAVGGIYDTLRDKLHVLDPDELADDLRENVYEPLLDPLRALDPAAIKAQVDGLYRQVLTLLTGRVRGFVDQVKVAVDRVLGQVREALAGVLAALRQQVADIVALLEEIIGRLDALILEDVFGRLLRMMDNLEASFNRELDRVRNGFDAMLDAIPLGSGTATASVSVGI